MDCNECSNLLFDEEEQDYLKSAIKYTVPHWCEKYQKRVFHHPYKEPRIHPCRECLTEREKTMGNNKTEVRNLTQEEWRKEGRKRFGLDFKNWKFKCPHCGNIASGAEFKEAGAEPNAIYQECIGRYVKGKGCNWAAYGLLDICTVRVDDVPVFEFGEGDAK